MPEPIKIGQLPRGRLIDINGQPTTAFLLWIQQQVQAAVAQKTDVVIGSTNSLAQLDSYGNLAASGKEAPASDIVGTSDIQTLSNKTLVTPSIGDFTNATHNHHDAPGGGLLDEESLLLTDVTTNNASVTEHGFLPKLSGSVNDILNGSGLWTTGYTGTLTVITAIGPPVVTATLTFKAGQLVTVA